MGMSLADVLKFKKALSCMGMSLAVLINTL